MFELSLNSLDELDALMGDTVLTILFPIIMYYKRVTFKRNFAIITELVN